MGGNDSPRSSRNRNKAEIVKQRVALRQPEKVVDEELIKKHLLTIMEEKMDGIQSQIDDLRSCSPSPAKGAVVGEFVTLEEFRKHSEFVRMIDETVNTMKEQQDRVLKDSINRMREQEENVEKLLKMTAPLRDMSSVVKQLNTLCRDNENRIDSLEYKANVIIEEEIPWLKNRVQLHREESEEKFKQALA